MYKKCNITTFVSAYSNGWIFDWNETIRKWFTSGGFSQGGSWNEIWVFAIVSALNALIKQGGCNSSSSNRNRSRFPISYCSDKGHWSSQYYQTLNFVGHVYQLFSTMSNFQGLVHDYPVLTHIKTLHQKVYFYQNV